MFCVSVMQAVLEGMARELAAAECGSAAVRKNGSEINLRRVIQFSFSNNGMRCAFIALSTLSGGGDIAIFVTRQRDVWSHRDLSA